MRRVVTVPNLVLHRSVIADTKIITGKVAVPCRKVILVNNEIGTNITYSVQGSCLLSYKQNEIKRHLF